MGWGPPWTPPGMPRETVPAISVTRSIFTIPAILDMFEELWRNCDFPHGGGVILHKFLRKFRYSSDTHFLFCCVEGIHEKSKGSVWNSSRFSLASSYSISIQKPAKITTTWQTDITFDGPNFTWRDLYFKWPDEIHQPRQGLDLGLSKILVPAGSFAVER